MNQYAYVRVSTKSQNVDRQIIALKGFDLPKKNIFCDYQSGKDFDRPAYKRLLRKLKEGDLLIIKSIDRLGRNYSDILVQWQHITKEIKADNPFKKSVKNCVTEYCTSGCRNIAAAERNK